LESFLLFQAHVHQPTIFFRRSLLEEVGYLDESLQYAMDCEFYMRVVARHDMHSIARVLGNFRIHAASKTSQDFLGSIQERISANRRYWGRSGKFRRWRYAWAARQQEASAHLHCSYLSLRGDPARAVMHIGRAVALYPPILFGRAVLSQLLQVMIGPERTLAVQRRLSREKGSPGAST
jgi:hypothetical protein